MLIVLEPNLVKIRENPFSYPIKTVTLRPNTPLKNKNGDDYRGIRVEVEYHVGHILYYAFQDNLDLFEALVKFMTPVPNKEMQNANNGK